MTDAAFSEPDAADRAPLRPSKRRRGRTALVLGGLAVLTAAAVVAWQRRSEAPPVAAGAAPAPPEVTVAAPLQATIASPTSFLGQFSAVDSVPLRAQVGGTLTQIGFRDGQVVHKGDLLFVIDPRPYQVKLDQAVAQLQTATARKALTEAELWRAQQLQKTSFGTAETVDQRSADQRSAEAQIATAAAAIRDAQLDIEFARITAPFDGRIGARQVSLGSLVSGSRGGAGNSTLLATVVSLDPIYLDFEMSEADYARFLAAHGSPQVGESVLVRLDPGGQERHGTLDFIDNVVDRSSGTIHARATVPNPNLGLTPGQFARVEMALSPAAPALLIPAAAIVPDQSRQIALTVGADGKVLPKPVETGALYRGLRIVKSGLAPEDKVIISGLVRARPGGAVTPVPGKIDLARE